MVKCDKCGKKLSSEEALEQHLEDYDHNEIEEDGSPVIERLMNSNWVGVAFISLILLVGGVFVFNAVSQATKTKPINKQIDNTDDPFLGDSKANVTILYFGDYGCPLCNRFEQRTFPKLKKQIIEKGKAKFVKKNFPVVTSKSPQLAVASQAVWNQVKDSDPSKFWEWHENIYDNQGSEHSGWATEQRIIELTNQIKGIDSKKVKKALNQNKYKKEVQRDLRKGKNLGVRGTPTFIIYNNVNGESTKLVGPQPVNSFENAILSVKR